jgi:hypothetical protein
MYVLEGVHEIVQKVPQRVHLWEEYKVMIWPDYSNLIVKNQRHLVCSLGDRRCHLSTIPEATSGPVTPQSHSSSTLSKFIFNKIFYRTRIHMKGELSECNSIKRLLLSLFLYSP